MCWPLHATVLADTGRLLIWFDLDEEAAKGKVRGPDFLTDFPDCYWRTAQMNQSRSGKGGGTERAL